MKHRMLRSIAALLLAAVLMLSGILPVSASTTGPVVTAAQTDPDEGNDPTDGAEEEDTDGLTDEEQSLDDLNTEDGDGLNTEDGDGLNTEDGDGLNTEDGDGLNTEDEDGLNTEDGDSLTTAENELTEDEEGGQEVEVFAAGSVTLAKWETFTSTTLSDNVSAGEIEASFGIGNPKGTLSLPSGGMISSNGWNTSEQYWYINTSSVGYESLNITFAAMSSNTGPANFSFQYSTVETPGDADFTEVKPYTLVGNNTRADMDIDLPAEADDAEFLTLRFIPLNTTSINGGTVTAAGTSRIGTITLTGDESGTGGGEPPIGEKAEAPAVTASNEYLSNTAGYWFNPYVEQENEITLTSAEGTTIDYTINGGDKVVGGSNEVTIGLDFGEDETLEIKATAKGGDLAESDPLTVTAKEIPELTVAEAQARSANTTNLVMTQGVVTYKLHLSNTNTVAMQDDTAGINVYNVANLIDYIGQEIRVIGTIDDYSGLQELVPGTVDNITVVDPDAGVPEPKEITGAQAFSGDYESQYVTVKDLKVTKLLTNTNPTYFVNNELETAEGQKIVLRSMDVTSTGIAVGDWVTVTGAMGQYNADIQLMMTDLGGIVKQDSEPEQPNYDGDVTLASWAISTADFPADDPKTSTSILAHNGEQAGEAVLTAVKNDADTAMNFSSGGANWNGLAGLSGKAYWLVKLDGTGVGNLQVGASLRSSGTGPRDFAVEYSTDEGATWTLASKIPALTTTLTAHPAVTLPNSANNQENLWVRWVIASNARADQANGTDIGSGGTNQINSITVNGSYVLGENQLHKPVADPPSGPIATGATVTFTPHEADAAVEGYQVMLSTDGGESYAPAAEYIVPTEVPEESWPIQLQVKATATGKDDSAVLLLEYIKGKTMTPVSSHISGAYDDLDGMTLTSDEGAEIWYSLDGEDPAKDKVNSTKYDPTVGFAHVALTAVPLTFKAIAYTEGREPSDVAAYTYEKYVAGNYTPYFGQLHSHTNFSDGAGTVEDGFAYASNVDGLDFLAITDHSNSFDNETAGEPTATSGINGGTNSTGEFAQGRAAAEAITSADFVGIYGYEMTWSGSTGGFGHINTFNTAGYESRNNSYWTSNSSTMEQNGLYRYYERMKQSTTTEDGSTPLNQLNHPGTTFGDFLDFKFYDTSYDPYVQMIEVGNGEGLVGSGGYFRSYEYYTRALDKGWHVAPTNNQDNHKGLWGNANTARTVVLADSLTQSGLYDGIRDRRVYATEDENLTIDYTLNGREMGFVYPTVEVPAGNSEVIVTLSHPDAKRLTGGSVKIIGDYGRTVASATIGNDTANGLAYTVNTDGSASFGWTVEVPSSYAYYYVQVDEAVGPTGSVKYRAVTAPVWMGDPVSAGFSKTVMEDLVPVAGQATKITSTLYNDEAAEFIVNSISYEAGGTVLHSNDNPGISISAGQTAAYSFDYTPVLGTTVINVTAECTLGGEALTFTDILTVTARDPKAMTYIGIDASKYGEYVAGNYANNFNNFMKITNANNMAVKLLREITAASLADCAVVIVPTPARRNGTYTPNNGGPAISYTAQEYTGAELDAFKAYEAGGGSFIIAGISDYGDGSEPYTAATQLNAVLSAIGAKTTISSDEVADDDNNKSDTIYRLAFPYDRHNADSPYVAGVKESQVYSFYSGCAVIPGGDAEVVVRGHDTTYSFVSKTGLPTTNDRVMEEGDVVALAAEGLPHGGTVWVGGTTFFSDFEIPDFDAGNNLEYSNMQITWNMLKKVQKEIGTSLISEARLGEEGEVYAIEGVVTVGTVAYDEDHAFFDCMYVQDDTAGINVFGIPEELSIPVGHRVKVTGTIHYYNGDMELIIDSAASVEDLGEDTAVKPTAVSTADARDLAAHGGRLVQVTGTVTEVNMVEGELAEIWLKDADDSDAKGARLFIDGYVRGTEPAVSVGDTVTGVGVVSQSDTGLRIRVRDRSEITLGEAPDPGAYAVQVYDSLDPDSGAGDYQVGDTVTIRAGSRSDYVFDRWSAVGVELDDANSATTTFEMPANPVSVTALWSYNGSGNGDGGSNDGVVHGDRTSGSGSGSGSTGSGGGRRETASTAPAANTPVNVTQSAADAAVNSALTNTVNGSATAKLTNPGEIALSVLRSMAEKAGDTALSVSADSLSGNAVDVRITLNPGQATKNLNLSGSTMNTSAVSVKNLFSQHYSNLIMTIALGQKESFGMPVQIAAKLPAGAKTDNLMFYSYNQTANTYVKIAAPAHWVDANGYVHFTTSLGGHVIVTNGPLVRR